MKLKGMNLYEGGARSRTCGATAGRIDVGRRQREDRGNLGNEASLVNSPGENGKRLGRKERVCFSEASPIHQLRDLRVTKVTCSYVDGIDAK